MKNNKLNEVTVRDASWIGSTANIRRSVTIALLGVSLLCGGCSKGSSPFLDKAYAKCVEKGLNKQDMKLSGYQIRGVFGETAVVNLWLKKGPTQTQGEGEKTIRIELHRAFLSSEWIVDKYDDEASAPKK